MDLEIGTQVEDYSPIAGVDGNVFLFFASWFENELFLRIYNRLAHHFVVDHVLVLDGYLYLSGDCFQSEG